MSIKHEKTWIMNADKMKLWDAFLQEWPMDRLKSMSLEEYSNLNRDDSFCYWLESKTTGLGSIWGGSSYKFGIYHRSKSAKKDKRSEYKTEGNYSWVLKYGGTKEIAFETIKENIVAVARFAENNDLDMIEDVELSHVVKWKIAALYNKRLPLVYSKEAIDFISDHFSIDKQLTYSAKLQKLAALNQDSDILSFSEKLWTLWDEHRQAGTSSNYWLFQGNPKIYDVVGSLKAGALKSWSVSAHKAKIKEGDKVILWVTGDESGCYALCRVSSGVMKRKDDEIEQEFYTDKSTNEIHDRVALEIELNLAEEPLLKKDLLSLPEFADFKGGNQGTNYTATKEQYLKIQELYWEKRMISTLNAVGDRRKIEWFFTLAGKLVREFDLHSEDPRISFSTPKSEQNKIAITIGQRYVIDLTNEGSSEKPHATFGMIAPTENEAVFKSVPGFVRFGNFSAKKQESAPFFAHFDDQTLPDDDAIITSWLGAVESELNRTDLSGFKQHHNPMFFKAVVDADYQNELLNKIFKPITQMNTFPLNQIFFGPPGTGKTYNTINKCIEILDPLFDLTQPRKIIKDKFEFLRKEGRIDLVTFHQSMSYEDFVEGIKPFVPEDLEDNDDNIEILPTMMYKIEDGIFKRLCMRATTNISQKFDFDDLWDKFATKLIASNDEVVFKSVDSELKLEKEISSINSLKVRFKKSWRDPELEGTAIFHVGKETMRNIFNERINLADPNLKPRVAVREIVGTSRATTFYAVYRSFFEHSDLVNMFSQTDTTLPFVIIIDEINRGNISQIFGELITLIEDDKRQGKPESLEAILPYSKTKFSIPQNVYIIGTMNTADRSIEALDTALRRRFTFVEMAPEPELIAKVGKSKGEIEGIDLVKLLATINERIEKLIDKDHQIGHSYFLDIADFDELKIAFKNKVIPLLEEYFYGDFGKIGLVLGSGFVIQKKKSDFSFADFKEFDNDIITDLKDRKVFEITDSETWTIEDFIRIYQK